MRIRHGDVIIEKIDDDQKMELEPIAGPLVLAEGEVTGHAHRVTPDTGVLWKIKGTAVKRLDLKKSATVAHEEHMDKILPPGSYKIRLKRQAKGESWEPVRD